MAVILASQSPRRRELLERMGIRALSNPARPGGGDPGSPTVPGGAGGDPLPAEGGRESPPEQLRRISSWRRDTVVSVDGRILGKPRDERQAAEMLAALSGREHTVYTGVTVRRGKRSRDRARGHRGALPPLAPGGD